MESIFSSGTEEKLELYDASIKHLAETAKWGKFLGIVQFVGVALIVVIAIAIGVFLPELNKFMPQESAAAFPIAGGFIMFIYLIMAVIMFFPALYLYKYSVKLKKAILEKNSDVLVDAFKNQKSLYVFFGVITLIILAMYAIGLIGMLFGGMMAAF